MTGGNSGHHQGRVAHAWHEFVRVSSRVLAVPGKGLASVLHGFLVRSRFANLTRRITIFNVVALFVLVGGILYLNQFQQSLIDARKQAMLTQAEIIAGAIAQAATSELESRIIGPPYEEETGGTGGAGARVRVPDETLRPGHVPIIAEKAAPVLRRLVLPTRTHARLYDKNGTLVLDSRQLTESGRIISFALPPPASNNVSLVARLLIWLREVAASKTLKVYQEAGNRNGYLYNEVASALHGNRAATERITRRGELIVSVAAPVQRFRAVLGAVMLSTEEGDIDAIVRAERMAIVEVFLIALAVAIFLSVVLAGTITEPVRRLASAADKVGRGKTGRAEIPDFTGRKDEIGDLSGSLRAMTDALYNRIDAIESFAADVTHELKNPLTSIRSALETLAIAKTEEAREKLTKIVQQDIRRIDRLISDISEASRLDAEMSRQEPGDVDLLALLETVVDLFNQTGTLKDRYVVLERGAGLSREVNIIGHDGRLAQVVRNLIDNALSFTPDGGTVWVRVHCDGTQARFVVEDEGTGIPEASLGKIFERFHSDRPGNFGEHSGLGLSISRQIVDAHGGRIWAENREQGGARILVELPVR